MATIEPVNPRATAGLIALLTHTSMRVVRAYRLGPDVLLIDAFMALGAVCRLPQHFHVSSTRLAAFSREAPHT